MQRHVLHYILKYVVISKTYKESYVKKVDIRKIYICKIQAVSDVFKEITDEDEKVRFKGNPLVIGKKI